MPDSPVSRGTFLRSFGKSVTGMALGTGVATAAQALANRLAAVSPADGETAPEQKLPASPDPFIYNGPTNGNQIALTFDDGPTPGVTDRILDEFRQRNLHATFFMIGRNIAAAPDLARRVVAEGHEIASHTFTHPKLTDLPPARVEEEIQKTHDIISETLGLQPLWFRPPYLAFRRDLAPFVLTRNMKIVEGNIDPADWSQPGEEKIIDVLTRDATPGAIAICHDLHAQTANAIGAVLDRLIANGLTPVTLSMLFAD